MTPSSGRPVFTIEISPTSADIDELGHVNNAVYVRWIQDIATAHWRAVAPAGQVDRVVWVVTRHEIDYRAPSLSGDALTLRTWVGNPKGARFDRYVEVLGPDGKARVRAVTTWALVDRDTRRPLRVTADIAAPFLG